MNYNDNISLGTRTPVKSGVNVKEVSTPWQATDFGKYSGDILTLGDQRPSGCIPVTGSAPSGNVTDTNI